MKVLLDSGVALESEGRGVGVYTQKLYKALADLSKKENLQIELEQASSTDLTKYDLVHYPFFDFFFHTLPVKKVIPRVVTIHDTIPLIYPSHYPPGVKGRARLFLQKQSLKNVDAVITDSETSKKDIVRLLNVSNTNIFPIYLGPTKSEEQTSKKERNDVLKKYNISFDYIVYIGDVNWNKNVTGLCEACEISKIHLVIVGKKAVDKNYDKSHPENFSLNQLQQRFSNSKYVHRTGFVSDREASILIQESELLCQPSFYEGFGLSVLDAMNLGVPTVCAKTQTLVELYEKATIFFNPYDTKDMASTIKKVFENTKLKKELSNKGIALSKSFSWNKSASETLKVYKQVLK